MAENTLDNLNDLQFDVLKEIGNIGAGNATTALAKMMNMKIDCLLYTSDAADE